MAEKFLKKEFFKKLNKTERKTIGDKAFLLANGMIDVHGYGREKAYEEAVLIASDWYENGGSYFEN